MGKVSVIMGIYNCEKTLEEAIDSIINQSYKNWELLMCDDCSRDKTYEIAEKYRKRYPDKIKLLRNEKNLTLGPTLNRCLEVATGEYIARQDGDDKSYPDRLEKQLKFLLDNPEFDLVGSSMMVFSGLEEKGIRKIGISEPTKMNLVLGVPFCHATIVARKEVYDRLGGYSTKKHAQRVEDVDLWFRFFKEGMRGHNLDEPLYLVRDDDGQYKRRDFKNHLNATITCLKGVRDLNLPTYYYIYALNPILKFFVPSKLKKIYHRIKLANENS
ncbi:MAG: glycosyltransferase family 2 protein [Fusobacteriaceae bacterium]